MLDSVKIQRRQSEIRQSLAELVGKETPTDDETRSMDTLDREYRQNETRYRAALVAEDTERREAGADLETRADREWSELAASFELRQAAFALDEGRALTGQTAELVQEMRAAGGYRGIPIPFEALETRAGETLAAATPNPRETMPIVDRLFASTAAARMGIATLNIPAGEREYPVVSSSITAGWANGELAPVPVDAFATVDKALAPDHNFGVQLRVSRKALKQSGAGLEAAMRRDLSSAIRIGLDEAAFLGSGSAGEPLGIIPGAATYGITVTAVNAVASWSAIRAAVTRFMLANAASGPGDVRLALRPEVWDGMDDTYITGTAVTEWERLMRHLPAVALTTNGLAAPAVDPAAPAGTPPSSAGLLTTTAGGLPPAFLATWGGVDLIRDPYSDAQSGQLRLTGIVTADVTVARGSQLEILTGLQ